jgi:hypothetical protein
MSRIHVYDEVMGSGKTSRAIERMKSFIEEDKKFIYVTPFLSEVDRVVEELPFDSVKTPLEKGVDGKLIVDVDDGIIDEYGRINLNGEITVRNKSKREQFINFMVNRKSIITTHSLFLSLKLDDYSFFNDYILILDEVVSPVNVFKIGKDDVNLLKKGGLISVDDNTKKVKFVKENYIDNGFKEVKKICRSGDIFLIDECHFVWVFPIEIFKNVSEIQILTYLFEGSMLCAYLKLYNFEYTIHKPCNKIALKRIKSKLNIYQGNANESKYSNKKFSHTKCKRLTRIQTIEVRNNVCRIFRREFDTKSKENAFTTFKCVKEKFSGGGYTRGFIAVNARATNDFNHKKSMAYLANRFFNPQIKNFFSMNDIDLNEDLWALSELVQWLWRGCIRNDDAMNVYLPCYRMRNILIKWLDGEYE